MTTTPSGTNNQLFEMNHWLCDFSSRWTLDGDYLRCKQCKRPQLASKYDQNFAHEKGCKNAATSEGFPWKVLVDLLSPLRIVPPPQPVDDRVVAELSINSPIPNYFTEYGRSLPPGTYKVYIAPQPAQSSGDAELAVLREYRKASINFQNTVGAEDCTADGERKAEDRFESASKAAYAFYSDDKQPAAQSSGDALEILRRVWQPHTQSNVDRMSEADIAQEIDRELAQSSGEAELIGYISSGNLDYLENHQNANVEITNNPELPHNPVALYVLNQPPSPPAQTLVGDVTVAISILRGAISALHQMYDPIQENARQQIQMAIDTLSAMPSPPAQDDAELLRELKQ